MRPGRRFLMLGALAAAASWVSCDSRELTTPKAPRFDTATLTIAGKPVEVVLAHSPREFESGVEPLHDVTPMLANYQPPFRFDADYVELHSFWEAGDYRSERYAGSAMPTDLVFFDEEGRVLSVHREPGAHAERLGAKTAKLQAHGMARYALRAPEGFAKKHGLTASQVVEIPKDVRQRADRKMVLLQRGIGSAKILAEVLAMPDERATLWKRLGELDDGEKSGLYRAFALVFDRNEPMAARESWIDPNATIAAECSLLFMRGVVESQPSQYGRPTSVRKIKVTQVFMIAPGALKDSFTAAKLPATRSDGSPGFEVVFVTPGASHERIGYDKDTSQPLAKLDAPAGVFDGGLWQDVVNAARAYYPITLEAEGRVVPLQVDVATTISERENDIGRFRGFPTLNDGVQTGVLGIYTAKPELQRRFRDLFGASLGYSLRFDMDLAFIGRDSEAVAYAATVDRIVHIEHAGPDTPGWSSANRKDDYAKIGSGGKYARSILWLPRGFMEKHRLGVGTVVHIPDEVEKLSVQTQEDSEP